VRARIACGTAKVIALVFFRLIANSNLVGCLTGISVGRVPRMMRSIMRTAARIESVSYGPMRRGRLPLRSLRLRYRRQPRAVQPVNNRTPLIINNRWGNSGLHSTTSGGTAIPAASANDLLIEVTLRYRAMRVNARGLTRVNQIRGI
jgi:hypothetical protein